MNDGKSHVKKIIIDVKNKSCEKGIISFMWTESHRSWGKSRGKNVSWKIRFVKRITEMRIVEVKMDKSCGKYDAEIMNHGVNQMRKNEESHEK